MYKAIFEFETKEDANVLITLVEETKLTPVLNDLRVEVYSYKEKEAEFVKDSFNVLLERRDIIFESWVIEQSDEYDNESSGINYYAEYGLKESDFY